MRIFHLNRQSEKQPQQTAIPGFLEGGGSHFGIAQNWAYCKMFDQIQDRSETAIVLHDDNYLRLSFHRYEQIVNQISRFCLYGFRWWNINQRMASFSP